MTERDPSDDRSMQYFAILGRELIKRDIAISYAALVIEAEYGADCLVRQLPLRLDGTDTAWIVRGSWTRDESVPAGDGEGVVVVEIAKFDGRILGLRFEDRWVPLTREDYEREVSSGSSP